MSLAGPVAGKMLEVDLSKSGKERSVALSVHAIIAKLLFFRDVNSLVQQHKPKCATKHAMILLRGSYVTRSKSPV